MAQKVAAGLIKKGDKFLLVRRPLNKKRGGLWEFPGGKVEEGETLEEAIKRELKEELDIEVNVKGVLSEVKYNYPEGEIELYLLEVESNEEPKLKEAIEKNPEKFRDDFHRAFPQLKPKRKRDVKQPKGSI